MVTQTLAALLPGSARLVGTAPAASRMLRSSQYVHDPAIAVLDIGATCTSATVVIEDGSAEPQVAGRPQVLTARGGDHLDALLFHHVLATIVAGGSLGDRSDPQLIRAARSFLDGHVVLTRQLAESGHYPAIDIEQSISRVMTAVTTPLQQASARRLKSLWSRYQRSRELITLGAYAAGSAEQTDLAIRLMPEIERFRGATIRHGDRLVTLAGGGAGVGRPEERDPAAVREDVRNELVTVAMARETYKVVIDPVTLDVDDAATAALRAPHGSWPASAPAAAGRAPLR